MGPELLLEAAGRVRLLPALLVVALSVLWLSLGAFNVWILLRRLGAVPFPAFLGVYVTSWTAGLLIPGQLGDAVQVVLLRRWHVAITQSAAAYLVDKALSLAWLLSVAALGVRLYLPSAWGWWLLAPPLLILTGLAWMLSSGEAGGAPERTGGGGGRSPGRLRAWLLTLTGQVRTFRRRPGTLAANGLVTVLKWGITTALYLATFLAFDTAIEPLAAATLPVMASLVGYLPVTVAGAGTMEITAVFLFGELGVAAATVVVAYLFLRVALLLAALALLLLAPTRPDPEAQPSGS